MQPPSQTALDPAGAAQTFVNGLVLSARNKISISRQRFPQALDTKTHAHAHTHAHFKERNLMIS